VFACYGGACVSCGESCPIGRLRDLIRPRSKWGGERYTTHTGTRDNHGTVTGPRTRRPAAVPMSSRESTRPRTGTQGSAEPERRDQSAQWWMGEVLFSLAPLPELCVCSQSEV
jgi:hypothetical protein